MDPRIAWALEQMERRLSEPLRMRALAESVQLSPSRFTHLFCAEMGISPVRYLQTQRMERARVLLERSMLTVKEVMLQVGCNDPSHFARDFRRYHGVPPSAWRTHLGYRPREATERTAEEPVEAGPVPPDLVVA